MNSYLKILLAVISICIWCLAGIYYAELVKLYFGPSEKLLSETGFFKLKSDENENSGNLFQFTPISQFWSDGAKKHRHLYLPAGKKIDNSNPDRLNFPVGSRIWKDFKRDGISVETRMMLKTGVKRWEWDFAVYSWQKNQNDAEKLFSGKSNISGTSHDIPSPKDCRSCHGSGHETRPLGLTSIQLPWNDSSSLSITKLIELDLLSIKPMHQYEIPGDSVTKKALGYLDTNCGSCHYEGSTYVDKEIPLRLNLTSESIDNVYNTHVYRTAIMQKSFFNGLDTDVYVHPGKPNKSYLYKRLSIRDGSIWQMPPLATKFVDHEGAEYISNWILSLSDIPEEDAMKYAEPRLEK